MPVAVVTDSTAYLPPELVRAHRLTVVPLTVVLNGAEGLEGVETGPDDAARALGARRVSVSTSRPAPEQFGRTYRRLLAEGAEAVLSVHLSAGLSGTVEGARAAAAELGDDRVAVVDSRSAGMGIGFPALAAARTAARGAHLAEVRDAALAAVDRTTIFFYVDTLEFLRRGGRINAAEALLGTALSVKPIMHMVDGAIVVRDKVRTASRDRPRRDGGRRRRGGPRGAPPRRAAPGRATPRRPAYPARRPGPGHVPDRGGCGGRGARRAGTGLRGGAPPAVIPHEFGDTAMSRRTRHRRSAEPVWITGPGAVSHQGMIRALSTAGPVVHRRPRGVSPSA
jgi:DegV family protein with EDD domain